jgi:energy-converting hydrogenase Eha subunit F
MEMRDKFANLEPELGKFTAYLRKVAAYLTQNVADTAEVVDQIAAQNVASIRKPQ